MGYIGLYMHVPRDMVGDERTNHEVTAPPHANTAIWSADGATLTLSAIRLQWLGVVHII